MTDSQRSAATLDIRRLPSSHEAVVQRNGGLFPVLARGRPGEAVATFRGGAGHLGARGHIDLSRSRDAGMTWSAPTVIVDSEWDDANKAFGRVGDTLVLAYASSGAYTEDGDFDGFSRVGDAGWRKRISHTLSTDDGYTWRDPSPLDIPELLGGTPFGKVVVGPSGTALMSVYVSAINDAGDLESATWLIKSDDRGTTWSSPRLIASDMNETGLAALDDGTVVAVMRAETKVTKYAGALSVARSGDLGATWSAPTQITATNQHPADLHLLSDGALLLSYGNRNPPYRIEGLVSRDGGRSWLDRTILFSGPLYGVGGTHQRVDLGYPSTVVIDTPAGRRGITVYYVNPNIDRIDDLWKRRDNPLFEPAGYLAISVSWSETELLEWLG